MKNIKGILIVLFLLFAASGLLVMLGMLTWSFHLEKDFTGRYETPAFFRHFWNIFLGGAGFYLLGCLGLSAALETRAATRGGITALAATFVFLFLMIPNVDFEGWTGAAAYTLATVAFAGDTFLLVPVCVKWLWRKARILRNTK
jgi:hypothetical protein